MFRIVCLSFCVDYEITRQSELLEQGQVVTEETRSFDVKKGLVPNGRHQLCVCVCVCQVFYTVSRTQKLYMHGSFLHTMKA